MSDEPLPNEKSYKEQIDFHRFTAVIWASLAKDARDMLARETYATTRDQLEAFVVRTIERAKKHYLEADVIRRRGHQ